MQVMDPLREEMWEWIRSRCLSDFHVVLVDHIIPYLHCLTQSDVEQIQRDLDRYGNKRGIFTLLNHLWRRSDWYNQLIDALRREKYNELADRMQAELSARQAAQPGPLLQNRPGSSHQPVMQPFVVAAIAESDQKSLSSANRRGEPSFSIQASSDPPATSPAHLSVHNKDTRSTAAESANESLTTPILSGGAAAVASPIYEATGASSPKGSSADVSSDDFLEDKNAKVPVQETQVARAPTPETASVWEEAKRAPRKATFEQLPNNAALNAPKQRASALNNADNIQNPPSAREHKFVVHYSQASPDQRSNEDEEDIGKPQVLSSIVPQVLNLNPSDGFTITSDDLQISDANTLEVSAVNCSGSSANEDSLPWVSEENGARDSDPEEDDEHEEVNHNEDTAELRKKPGENIDDKIRALQGYCNPELSNNAIDIHSPLLLQIEHDNRMNLAKKQAQQKGISTEVSDCDRPTNSSSPQLCQFAAPGNVACNNLPYLENAGISTERPSDEGSEKLNDEQYYVQHYSQPQEQLDEQPNEPRNAPRAVPRVAATADPLPDQNRLKERLQENQLVLAGAALLGLMAIIWFRVHRRY